MRTTSTAVRSGRYVAAVLVAGIAVAALAGCMPQPTPTPSGTAGAVPTPSSSATDAAATPTPTAAPVEAATGGTPVGIACDSVVTAQAMYDFNPNFGLDSSFTPKAGTPAATAVADKGVACNWTNQTSRDTITISVAKPNGLAALKSSAAAGTAVSGYGDAAYFSPGAGGAGRVDVFSGAYWITAVSVYFGSATDAAALLKQAVSAAH